MRRKAACIAAAALCAALAALATAASGDTDRSRPATAVAKAFARQEPSGDRLGFVSVEGDGETAGEGTRVSASTGARRAVASASANAEDVDIFGGLVTARSVRVRAEATGDGTSTSGSVAGLAINGRALPSPAERTTYDLDGYGRLVALDDGRTGVLGLRARLTEDYKTYEAGDVVRIAYASASAADAVIVSTPAPAAEPDQKAKESKPKAKRLTVRQRRRRAVRRRRAREARKLLAAPGYAFPVAGQATFSDDYGAPRADTGTHIGNDVFAAFGTPIVAVADGRLYRVGTRKIPGNRLWLRDRHGHRFFYAHLADFAAAAYNGADVHAGEIIGFVGSTGDAEPTPPHLHFEVHLSDRSPTNPYKLLLAWQRSGAGTAKWLRRYGQDPGVRPGALVVVKDFLAEPQ